MNLTEKLNVPHVIQAGSRHHVTSYSLVWSKTNIINHFVADWCSEPFCENNAAPVRACVRHGQDPVEICPLPRLKEWLASEAGRLALTSGSKPE